jgi:hypothetical protein
VDNIDQLAPLCFVLMPFGTKTDAAGRVTNFDKVYQNIIVPAVTQAASSRCARTRRRSAARSTSRCSSG